MPFIPDKPAASGRFVPDAQPAAAPAPVAEPSFMDRVMADLKAFGRTALGAADAAYSGASNVIVGGMIGGAAGLGARATGNDPAKAHEWVNENLVYHPQTEVGNQIGNTVKQGLSPIGTAFRAVDKTIGDVAGPNVQNFVRSAAGTASDIAGVAPLAGATVSAVRAANIPKALLVARAPDEIAREAGFKVRPSDVRNVTGAAEQPSVLARAVETIGGNNSAMRADFVRTNKARVNDIAAQDIGLPSGTPLNKQTLAKAEDPHAAVYEQVKKAVGDTPLDDQFIRDVLSIGRGNASVLPVPNSVKAVQEQVLSVEKMNGNQLVDTISDLRNRGWKEFNSEDADIAAAGNARLDIANALERRLDRAVQASAPELAGKYQAARVGFAKINTVRRAIEGGDVNPQILRDAAAKTDAIDGGLKIIADTATNFPKVMQRDVPEVQHSGFDNILAYGSLGAVPLAKAIARKSVSATRGEATNPQFGLGTSLADYYTRGYDQKGIFAPRGPLENPRSLLPAPSQVPLRTPNQGLNPADQVRSGVHPGEPKYTPPTLALPPPSKASPKPAQAPDASTLGPSNNRAAMDHPGYAGEWKQGESELTLAPDVPMPVKRDIGDVPLHDVLIGGKKIGTDNVERALRLYIEERTPKGPTPLKADPSNAARGEALARILEGYKRGNKDRTLQQLAKAVEDAAKKEKK